MHETFLTIRDIVEVLGNLKIPYLIGGSVASSALGIARDTNDVDMVVQIRLEDVSPFVDAVKSDYYVDHEMISEAIQTGSSFNLLHLTYFVKVDMFVKQDSEWTNEVWKRRQEQVIESEGESLSIVLPSPEDMILQKLRWFQMGGGVSDRQWSDISGMLKVQGERLDFVYLHRWAENLGLTDLLEQARSASRV